MKRSRKRSRKRSKKRSRRSIKRSRKRSRKFGNPTYIVTKGGIVYPSSSSLKIEINKSKPELFKIIPRQFIGGILRNGLILQGGLFIKYDRRDTTPLVPNQQFPTIPINPVTMNENPINDTYINEVLANNPINIEPLNEKEYTDLRQALEFIETPLPGNTTNWYRFWWSTSPRPYYVFLIALPEIADTGYIMNTNKTQIIKT
jgi:hypothetical protein